MSNSAITQQIRLGAIVASSMTLGRDDPNCKHGAALSEIMAFDPTLYVLIVFKLLITKHYAIIINFYSVWTKDLTEEGSPVARYWSDVYLLISYDDNHSYYEDEQVLSFFF